MTENEKVLSDAVKMREFQEEREKQRYKAFEEEAGRLRRQTRRLAWGLALALGLNAAIIFWPQLLGIDRGQGGSDVLRVQHLVLEDAAGVARGEWRVDDEGNSRLTLQDRQSRARLSLSVLSGGSPGLSLIDASGQRRAALALLPDETTTLVFADGKGIPRAVLGLNQADATHLVFADAQRSSRVALGLDGHGVGSFMVPEESPARTAPGR